MRLNPEQRVFVTERHLATLSTHRKDGSIHVVPVAFTWDQDAGIARVTTNKTSVKAKNALGYGIEPVRAVICQVEGGRWITLEGSISLNDSAEAVADAEERYAKRYRQLEDNPLRVVLELKVDKVMSSTYMAG